MINKNLTRLILVIFDQLHIERWYSLMIKNLVSKAKFPALKSHLPGFTSCLVHISRHQFSFFEIKIIKSNQFIGHYYRYTETYLFFLLFILSSQINIENVVQTVCFVCPTKYRRF